MYDELFLPWIYDAYLIEMVPGASRIVLRVTYKL